MKFARHEFELDRPATKDAKHSKRESLEQIAKSLGHFPEEYFGPEIPEEMQYIWNWFIELHNARGQGGLAFSEIKCWCDMFEIELSPFELEAIKAVDVCFLKVNE